MINATCQKEASTLAGSSSQFGTRYAWSLTKPDIRSRLAGGEILTIPKVLSADGHYPVLDNAVMHCFLHAATFAHRVCKAVAIGFLETTKKGSISNATPESMGQSAKSHFGHVNLFGDTYLYRAQPFGSMPKRSSSLRPNVLSQLAKLMPASEAATSNCAFSSGVIRTGKTGALPSDECLLSRFAIDMYIPTGLVFYLLGIYLITVNAEKETPPNGITSTSRGLTNNVMETNAMAKPQCNQTHPKFQYRFLAISRSDRNAKPCRMSVEAHTEREARQVLAPHFILSLAARLPMQGIREIVTPSTIEKTSTVQEVSYA